MRPSAFRRALPTLLVLAIACSAASCGAGRKPVLDVAVIGESLEAADPSRGPLTRPQAVLLSNMAQGLVRFDANGQIVPGLAERWNVTDDGLSYIFRLSPAQWSNGEQVTAHQVARILRRQIASGSQNALMDTFGAVDEIVAMTDRVLEIRLTAPRPNLLQILAQPELSLVREGQGTGPFRIEDAEGDGAVRLVRNVEAEEEGGEEQRDEVTLSAADTGSAVQSFARNAVDLVLGGTFADLPHVRAAELPRGALRFDPASGLFGLRPARAGGPLADVELRQLLSQAIDREALIAAFEVPGLLPRATVLEPGLDGTPEPASPPWMSVPQAQRRAQLAAAADRLFADMDERPTIRIAIPEGPGADLLLNRLASDWSVLEITVERARPGQPADLRLIDAVAPSVSPAWFLRPFRCGEAPVCSEAADRLIAAARAAPVAAQRAALLAQAAEEVDEAQLFIPIAAPIRWSLVSSHVQGFAPNRFARHTLVGLNEQVQAEGSD